MVAFLPLLSELMTTGDYFEREGRRIYVCEEAAGTMSGAGGTAIPFVIKALQSKNPLEVHAGLECAQDIVEFLEWRVETNDLPAVCSNLLPYVTICITNGVLETEQEANHFHEWIPDAAKKTERELKRFLQPTSSKE